MNIDEIIKNRRATPPRFLGGKNIEKEKIQRLLENANWAPNHKKTEPWRFIVFQGESKQKLADDILSSLQQRRDAGENVNMQKAEKFKENQKLLGFFFVGNILIDFPSPGRGPVEEKIEWR